jgi:2'-hydroxyisoflavone reductase
MNLLVIGGTRFVGRHIVGMALQRGHSVTLFNRGQTGPELFPEAEHVRGDRDGDLHLLGGRTWDAVVDTCGYVPRVVGASARLLSSAAAHYTFVSSLSVYPDDRTPGQDETAPVGTLADPTIEEVTDETYGPLKVLCEGEVERFFPGRWLVARCGLIVGPYDATDRFTYWVRRVAGGGEVLAPAPAGYRVQMIDARDLGTWLLDMVEGSRTGVYNVTGPDRVLTLEEVLETSRAVAGSDAAFTWVDSGFLLDAGVEPWTDLPLWLPGDEYAGFMASDVSKALRSGLRFRPLAETIAETLAWDRGRSGGAMKSGLTRERERELLEGWKARSGMPRG